MATVTVKKGDTLSEIAKDKGISLRALLGANPQIKNANKIRIGQKINIPEAKKAGDPKVSGSKTSNPYKRMSKTQMSMLSVRNKDEGKQSAVTRSIQRSVMQGAESRDRDAARKMEDPRGERAAMKKRWNLRVKMRQRQAALIQKDWQALARKASQQCSSVKKKQKREDQRSLCCAVETEDVNHAECSW